MEIKGKGLCVLAGLYFTIDYLITEPGRWIESLAAPIETITDVMFWVFVILLIVGLFRKEKFSFLQSFITKFPMCFFDFVYSKCGSCAGSLVRKRRFAVKRIFSLGIDCFVLRR